MAFSSEHPSLASAQQQSTITASHDSSNLHSLLTQWLPSPTPTSETAHPHGAQPADLQLQVLQQAQTKLQATQTLMELCLSPAHAAEAQPANSGEQLQQWHLLAQLLGISNMYICQLQFPAMGMNPAPKHRHVQTRLRGTVHTLDFSLEEEDSDTDWDDDDAQAVQSILLTFTELTGEADRQATLPLYSREGASLALHL